MPDDEEFLRQYEAEVIGEMAIKIERLENLVDDLRDSLTEAADMLDRAGYRYAAIKLRKDAQP